jgi:hypothetical protein
VVHLANGSVIPSGTVISGHVVSASPFNETGRCVSCCCFTLAAPTT